MAPNTKRPRAPKAAAPKSNKRQKVEPARKVGLSELAWKPVELPDRLDDYEGFFGLEEIDDVDIVKDEETGAMSFQTRSEEVIAKKVADGDNDTDAQSDDGSWEGFSDDVGEINGAEKEEEAQSAIKQKKEPKAKEPKPKEAKSKEPKAKEPKTKEPKAKESEAKDSEVEEPIVKGAAAERNAQKKRRKLEEAKEDEDTLPKNAFDILADQEMDDEDVDVDVSAWRDLALSQDTLDQLSRMKFSEPTPIQSSSIPEIMAGHDVIGKASTGSGKTLAFGIPILESFLANNPNTPEKRLPIALIISPTRELAHQITAHLTALCSGGDFNGPSIATITGGLSVQKQRRQLENANIIVGTPGRLWEVISSGHGLLASLRKIRFLVVDEADRLLSEHAFKEMGEILNAIDQKEFGETEEAEHDPAPSSVEDSETPRQTLVFSATFHKGLQQKLASKAKGGELMSKQESMEYLIKKLHFREEKPKFIDANPEGQMASRLKEGLVECAGTEKDLYCYALLMFHPGKRALVFTNSISAVRRVTPFLQNLGLPAFPLHSQMPQKARLRSVERFTERPGSILVATDVAARGLDIKGVQLIIHYHLPRAADTYVHRSGRTARAEASGTSILICAPEEVAGVRRLVSKLHAQAEKKQKTGHFIRTLDIDRRIVSRLKPRATLAKTLADAVIAKEKKHSENDFLKEAAEDLGVEYDSETFEDEGKGKRGRGAGRKKKEKEGRNMSKAELQGLRSELKEMLSQRINTGVSARYLTSGAVDVDALLKGEGNMGFLGTVEGFFDE